MDKCCGTIIPYSGPDSMGVDSDVVESCLHVSPEDDDGCNSCYSTCFVFATSVARVVPVLSDDVARER